MSTKSKIIINTSRRIRELRMQRELTQERLAALSGVDYKHIQLLESKNPPSIRIDTLQKICDGLQIRLHDFFANEIFY